MVSLISKAPFQDQFIQLCTKIKEINDVQEELQTPLHYFQLK